MTTSSDQTGESMTTENILAKFDCGQYYLDKISTPECGFAQHTQPSLAAAETLIECVHRSHPSTMFELLEILGRGQREIEAVTPPCNLIAVRAGCRAFRAHAGYVRTAQMEYQTFRQAVYDSGRKFVEAIEASKPNIARFALENSLIYQAGLSPDRPILIHSRSSVVLYVLEKLIVQRSRYGQRTFVLVTKSDVDLGGFWMRRQLLAIKPDEGLPNPVDVRIINDSSVGCVMETVSLVLLGAEAVTQDGGIVNRSGTLAICICAQFFKVNVVVLAEMFKWSDYCPRNNRSMAAEFKYGNSLASHQCRSCSGCSEAPTQVIDYTQGSLIKLHICEDGPMSSDAVSLEIINTFVR